MSYNHSPLRQSNGLGASQSPEQAFRVMAEEQNLAAERFIQELDASDRKRYIDQQRQLQENLLDSHQREAHLEEATISRYLVKGRSSSPSARGGAVQYGGAALSQSSVKNDSAKERQMSMQQASHDARRYIPTIGDTAQDYRTFQGFEPENELQKNLGNRRPSYSDVKRWQTTKQADDSPSYGQTHSPNGGFPTVIAPYRGPVEPKVSNQGDFSQQKPDGYAPNRALFQDGHGGARQDFLQESTAQNPRVNDMNSMRPAGMLDKDSAYQMGALGAGGEYMASPPEIGYQHDEATPQNESKHVGLSDDSIALNDRIKRLRNDLRGPPAPPEANSGAASPPQSLYYQFEAQRERTDNVLARFKSKSSLSPAEIVDIRAGSQSVEAEAEPGFGNRANSMSPMRQGAVNQPHDLAGHSLPSQMREPSPGRLAQNAGVSANVERAYESERIPSPYEGNVQGPPRSRGSVATENPPTYSYNIRRNTSSREKLGSSYRQLRTGSAQGSRSSQLRREASYQSVQSQMHPVQLKQVKFVNHDSPKDISQNQNPNIQKAQISSDSETRTTQESLTLDKFYQELIKKEREEFERILKSKVTVTRAEVTKKMRKQIEDANRKFQRVSELEKNLRFAKNNNERLRIEWEAMKMELSQTQDRLEVQQSENTILKKKLDSLWDKYEEEKDVVMLVTKSEVEKANAGEIASLQARLDQAEGRALEFESKVLDLESNRNTLEDENHGHLSKNAQIKADNELLKSKLGRFELENKRLKEELAKSQEEGMVEIKRKYEDMKKRYREAVASASSIMKNEDGPDQSDQKQAVQSKGVQQAKRTTQYQSQPVFDKINLTAGRKDGASTAIKIQSTNQNAADCISQPQSREATRKEKQRRSRRRPSKERKEPSPREQYASHRVNGEVHEKQEAAEIWRLRCKFLAEKYFNMIKDMKRNLQEIRMETIERIAEARKEMLDELIFKLQDHLSKHMPPDALRKSLTPDGLHALVTPGFLSLQNAAAEDPDNKGMEQIYEESHSKYLQARNAKIDVSSSQRFNQISENLQLSDAKAPLEQPTDYRQARVQSTRTDPANPKTEHDTVPSRRGGYHSQFAKHYGKLQALTGAGGSGGNIGVNEFRSSSNEDHLQLLAYDDSEHRNRTENVNGSSLGRSNPRSHSHYQHAINNLVPSSHSQSQLNQPNVGQTGLAGTSCWRSSQDRAGEYAAYINGRVPPADATRAPSSHLSQAHPSLRTFHSQLQTTQQVYSTSRPRTNRSQLSQPVNRPVQQVFRSPTPPKMRNGQPNRSEGASGSAVQRDEHRYEGRRSGERISSSDQALGLHGRPTSTLGSHLSNPGGAYRPIPQGTVPREPDTVLNWQYQKEDPAVSFNMHNSSIQRQETVLNANEHVQPNYFVHEASFNQYTGAHFIPEARSSLEADARGLIPESQQSVVESAQSPGAESFGQTGAGSTVNVQGMNQEQLSRQQRAIQSAAVVSQDVLGAQRSTDQGESGSRWDQGDQQLEGGQIAHSQLEDQDERSQNVWRAATRDGRYGSRGSRGSQRSRRSQSGSRDAASAKRKRGAPTALDVSNQELSEQMLLSSNARDTINRDLADHLNSQSFNVQARQLRNTTNSSERRASRTLKSGKGARRQAAVDNSTAKKRGSSLGRDSTGKVSFERRDAPQHNLGGVDDIKGYTIPNLNTFEKLNEQIQQSIQSLRMMSDQRVDQQPDLNDASPEAAQSPCRALRQTKASKKKSGLNRSSSSLSRNPARPQAPSAQTHPATSLTNRQASQTFTRGSERPQSTKKKTTPQAKKPRSNAEVITPSHILVKNSSAGSSKGGAGADGYSQSGQSRPTAGTAQERASKAQIEASKRIQSRK